MSTRRKKTRQRSIRITNYLNEILEEDAKAKTISNNALISTIATKYAEWDRYTERFGTRRSTGLYSGVMMALAEALNQDNSLTIYGDGKQTRDFVFVSDVVDAMILALKKLEATGETFNIGSGIQTNINQLAKLFTGLTSSKKRNLRRIHFKWVIEGW